MDRWRGGEVCKGMGGASVVIGCLVDGVGGYTLHYTTRNFQNLVAWSIVC